MEVRSSEEVRSTELERAARAEPSSISAVYLPLQAEAELASALPVARELARIADAPLHMVPFEGDEAGRARSLGIEAGRGDSVVVDEALGESVSHDARATWLAERAERDARGLWVLGLAKAAEAEAPVSFPMQFLSLTTHPVLLVPADRDLRGWRPNRALLAHDGEARTASSFAVAVELAARAGASFAVLHVPTLFGGAGEGAMPLPSFLDQPHYEWGVWSRAFLERMGLFKRVRAPLRLYLTKGDAADEIVKAVGDLAITLLAMGWRGASGSGRTQVIKHVVDRLPCPTIVTRTPDTGPWRPIGP